MPYSLTAFAKLSGNIKECYRLEVTVIPDVARYLDTTCGFPFAGGSGLSSERNLPSRLERLSEQSQPASVRLRLL
jgi:hypothetical protein